MQAVKLENVSFSYEDGQFAVNDFSLEINQGEFVAIVGTNGSGKSTVAKLINALLLPNSGKVTVFGMDTQDKKQLFEIRKCVGMVFQNPDNQMVATIVEDDVAFGPENLGVPSEQIKQRIDFALKVTDMESFRHRQSAHLSGGQKQRVAIAGALAINPKILILDEATSMLDPKGREEVMNIVKKLNKEQNMTVIAVTHYMGEAVFADRVIVTNNGQVVMQGTPNQVFGNEQQILKSGLSLPRATYIFNRLKERGVISGEPPLTTDQLEQRLCELLSRT